MDNHKRICQNRRLGKVATNFQETDTEPVDEELANPLVDKNEAIDKPPFWEVAAHEIYTPIRPTYRENRKLECYHVSRVDKRPKSDKI